MKGERRMENHLAPLSGQELIEIVIPEEKINLMAHLADENAKWLKIVDGGFLVDGEKVVPELQGVLIDYTPYFVRWVDKKPTKIAFEVEGQEPPEGYELRCDLRIDIAGTIIGLSLAKTSTKAYFSKYVKFLKNSGLQSHQVITRVRSKTVSSSHGKYNVAVFDCIGPAGTRQRPESSQADRDIIDVTAPAPTEPNPVDQQVNPWA
jgi:hypothetical protein